MSSHQGHLLGVKSFNYVWTIDNFKICSDRYGTFAESPLFPAEAPNNIPKWSLRINRTSDYFHFQIVSHGDPEVCASFHFSVLNKKGEKIKTVDSHICTLLTKQTSTIKFLTIGQANESLYENALTILCEVSCNVPKEKRIQEFGTLSGSKKWSDMVTLVVDGHELKAHKAILTSRSEVFAAMFEHEMEEQRLNRVSITDVEYEVFEEMLHYMYTGVSPNLDNMAQDLIAAADKYALESLKKMCAESLQNNISIDKSINTLILADKHNEEHLKMQVIDFIVTNATKVMETEGWEYLITSHGNLLANAFAKLHKNHVILQDHHGEFHKQCYFSGSNK